MENQILDDNAYKIFIDRYAKNGETQWTELCKRVADHICQNDKPLAGPVMDGLIALDFLFNSPALMNAGTEIAQLSACFKLPIKEDSMEAIFDAIKEMALVQKSGGGTGFNPSILREKGAQVTTTKGQASGIVSFLRVFNSASRAIEQGGVRRGANMLAVNSDHPDLIETIQYKAQVNGMLERIKLLVAGTPEYVVLIESLKELTYFNISIAMFDNFMQKVANWIHDGQDSMWDFISRKDGSVHHSEKISILWDEICVNAHKSGDPGMLFIDIINFFNPIPSHPMNGSNPCGEQPLEDDESCNLASMNIYNFIDIKNGVVNWKRLKCMIYVIVRALDNVIDVNFYPTPSIEEKTKANRKIGLGVMGIADSMYALGLRYGSPEAISWSLELQKFIQDISFEASSKLAEERGNFPNWDISIYAADNIPMRNACRTTVAPTGTCSILAHVSSCIEPVFSLAYDRLVRETHGEGSYTIRVVNCAFEAVLKLRGLYSTELLDKVVANGGSVQGLDCIPLDMQRVFVTAFDITIDEHLLTQQAFQKYVDSAVSKTINLPRSATKNDVSYVYLRAWELKLKGVTIYRDGSLDSQVLNLITSDEDKSIIDNYTKVKPRPIISEGYTVKLKSGCCDMNATIGLDDNGKVFEARISNSGRGGCSAMYAGLGMMTSEALRLGGDPKRIAKQLRQVSCPACIGKSGIHGKSCPDILGKLLENAIEGKASVTNYITNGKIVHNEMTLIKTPLSIATTHKITQEDFYTICPSCGAKKFLNESGCGQCYECGYNKCEHK